MATRYQSTKVIPLGSTAFRQPFAESHCRFLHGYRLQAKFWFECNLLDTNNWVVDFGSLKQLKTKLEDQFDHTTVIAINDPAMDTFKALHERRIINLRVMNGVGIEKFAEYCLLVGDEYVDKLTNGRCWVSKVEVWEHENNSAICYKEKVVKCDCGLDEVKSTTAADNVNTVVITNESTTPEPAKPNPAPANPQCPPLHTSKTSNSYKDMFKGTSWESKPK